jgi:hypothetical protein
VAKQIPEYKKQRYNLAVKDPNRRTGPGANFPKSNTDLSTENNIKINYTIQIYFGSRIKSVILDKGK